MSNVGVPRSVKPAAPIGSLQTAWTAGSLLPIHAAFFLSGFSALIYQTVWQRLLGLFAGSETVSATLTVGAFLFGLGIGSLWGGHLADRLGRARAMQAFALCEAGIAGCALLSRPVLYDVLFRGMVGYADSPVVVYPTVFLALLPPTLLMGMSLPLLARAVVEQVETAPVRIGWLYGINTLGAAVGTLLAGQLLIGLYGIETTVHVGAALNLAVAVVALAVSLGMTGELAPARGTDTAQAFRAASSARVALWCGIVFASGFLIISLEIVWFRVLGTLMQSNAYAFPIILAVFLAADGLGIVAGARVVRRMRDPLRAFQLLQGMMALYALASLGAVWWISGIVDLTPFFVDGTFFEARQDATGKALRLLVYGGVVTFAVFPPAFLLGMSFPFSQKAVQDDPGRVGRRVGAIQLANILGNTAGAVVTGLVLLHVLGTSGTLRLVGVAGLAFTAALFLGSGQSGHTRPRGTVVAAAALAGIVAAFPGNAAFWARLHGTSPAAGARVAEDRSGVVVLRPLPHTNHLYVGGKWQSDALPYRPVQGAMGALAAFAHPAPKSAMLVGYGGGGSLYATGLNPSIERIRVVEIVAPVLDVMDDLARDSRDPALSRLLSDKRVERIVGDGRHVVFTDDARFDVIKAETISPKTANSGFLYSIEYFEEIRRRLNPGGIVVQWAATERTVNTFTRAFPYVVRLGDAMIGSDAPIRFDMAAFEAVLRGPAAEGLRAAGWNADIIVGWLGSRPMQVWGPGDPRPGTEINTDLFPRDEYFMNR
ncbi:MAG TPA: fused MFS/spermidine synthase [Azospirillaceae bacterium]|nr:fused MFS/spermidine synthase [Azospirillaceae bacterium]